MQTLNGHKSFKRMSVENCLVRPNFGDTHQKKNYPNVSKIWNIDGADNNHTKKYEIFCFVLLVESSLLQKLHIDGSNICANRKGGK